ncbi:PfkB family carbohydrate kinase [Streptomyces sp. NPDC047072]|uniref:PfkB family carbohydrate kinase n=1 Tax=Streptomyces sp. NPDC047072 TaxID=3154809 RepID=UPI0033ECFE93
MAVSAQPFDLITMGRIGVDLHLMQSDGPLQQVDPLERLPGGSVAHVALAAARLGRSSAVITRTAGDSFAAYLHDTLTASGVDSRWVSEAPDLGFHTDDLDYFAIRAARILWIAGTGLSGEPCRSATLAALKARDRARTTVLDLDRHPQHPLSSDEARPYYAEALRHATVAVGHLDACEAVTGARGAHACAEALLAAGVEVAVVRLGRQGRGVLAAHRDGTVAEVGVDAAEGVDGSGASDSGGVGVGCELGSGEGLRESFSEGSSESESLAGGDGLGAGDSFGGRLCHGLLSGWELERIVRYAAAAGAASALPTQAADVPSPNRTRP